MPVILNSGIHFMSSNSFMFELVWIHPQLTAYPNTRDITSVTQPPFKRDYVIWRKLTGLDNGIDFFHDYYGLPKDPSELQRLYEEFKHQFGLGER